MVSYFWVQDYRNDTGMYKFWRKNSCDLIVSERFIILNSAATNPWTFRSLCCGSQQLDLRYLYLLCSGMTTTFMCAHYTTTRKAHGVLFPRWWVPNQASLISALHRTGHWQLMELMSFLQYPLYTLPLVSPLVSFMLLLFSWPIWHLARISPVDHATTGWLTALCFASGTGC